MKYYVLANPRNVNERVVTDFANAPPVNLGEAPKCPLCGAFIGSLPWLPPYRAELEVWGDEYGDIAFGPGQELLVVKRLADQFREEGLIGLSGFSEVEIVNIVRRGHSKVRTPPPPYYCVAVARSRAAIDFDASQLDQDVPFTCNECRSGIVKRTQRIILEQGTWSREDIFYPRGLPGTILTSERFFAFCEAHLVNNGVLIDAAEYSFDFCPWEGNVH
jgi:hypothetical protein